MSQLTKQEAATLTAYEAVIEQGLGTFVEVGNALAQIRDSRLYRDEFVTFEEYCRGRWQLTRQHVNRLIASAEVATDLEPMGSIPPTERQARPLASLPREERAEAWQEAVETAPEGKVTAKHVEEVVSKRKDTTSPPRFEPQASAADLDTDKEDLVDRLCSVIDVEWGRTNMSKHDFVDCVFQAARFSKTLER